MAEKASGPPNEGMKQTKPAQAGIPAGFAAYAQCWAGLAEPEEGLRRA